MIHKLPKSMLLVYAAYIVVVIIWALAGPVIKLTLDYIPPFTFLFLRFALVAIIMLPFTILLLKKNPIHKKDTVNIILLGALNILNLILVFWAIKYTTAIDYAVLTVIEPLLLIAAGHYFFKERVNTWVRFGVLIAALGTLYIGLEPLTETQTVYNLDLTHRLLGNLLVILAQVVFIAYVIWSKAATSEKSKTLNKTLGFVSIKPMIREYSAFLITALNFYIGFAILIPLVIAEKMGYFGDYTFKISSLTLVPMLGLLYMTFFSSIVAYMLFQWALAKSLVEDNAIFSYLNPIFTFPFAFLLLGEIPTRATVLGALIITVGIIIAETKKT